LAPDQRAAPEQALLEAKHRLRTQVLARRDALDLPTRQRHSRTITQQLLNLPEYGTASVVAAYASFGSEFDTTAFLTDILASRKRLVLPRVDRAQKRLALCEVTDMRADLQSGVWGIREPAHHCPVVPPSTVGLVLVPAVAVSPRGERLGYGGGYYDRLLAEMGSEARRVAAAYSIQLLNDLPTGTHDLSMDIVITETELIRR
jgi:5-formyltetrahydrofolate cyclo-ligase